MINYIQCQSIDKSWCWFIILGVITGAISEHFVYQYMPKYDNYMIIYDPHLIADYIPLTSDKEESPNWIIRFIVLL